MTDPVLQLRLIVETEDFDAALAFYRDALGLPEQESYEGAGGDRVAILAIPAATLELSNPAQIALIDDVEVGRPVARPYPLSIRVAFEVSDAAGTTRRLTEAGAELVAPPTQTPWRSLNARLEAPGGLQITAYQELETLEERAQKPGFGTDGERA
jgi:catechol 2,3-dioxygenase-like lactoylglutathione lyase family enzyme